MFLDLEVVNGFTKQKEHDRISIFYCIIFLVPTSVTSFHKSFTNRDPLSKHNLNYTDSLKGYWICMIELSIMFGSTDIVLEADSSRHYLVIVITWHIDPSSSFGSDSLSQY